MKTAKTAQHRRATKHSKLAQAARTRLFACDAGDDVALLKHANAVVTQQNAALVFQKLGNRIVAMQGALDRAVVQKEMLRHIGSVSQVLSSLSDVKDENLTTTLSSVLERLALLDRSVTDVEVAQDFGARGPHDGKGDDGDGEGGTGGAITVRMEDPAMALVREAKEAAALARMEPFPLPPTHVPGSAGVGQGVVHEREEV